MPQRIDEVLQPPTGIVRTSAQGAFDRVMEALESAAQVAETGEGCTHVQHVSVEDFQLTSEHFPVDVRRILDRVMMATDPEGGLDALLEKL